MQIYKVWLKGVHSVLDVWQEIDVLVSFNYTDAYILNVPEGYRGGAQYAMDDSRINQLTLPQWVDGDTHTQRHKQTQAEIQAHLAHR